MHVDDALERLDAIHDALARSEAYRGIRVPTAALIGVMALAAALLQDRLPGVEFAAYWSAVAGVGLTLGFAAGVRAYLVRENDFERRRTRRVLFQFLPAILVGGAVTLVVARSEPEFAPFLPGLWAALFGLGLIAASPHFHATLGLVGLGYVLAGLALLFAATPGSAPSGWSVGGPFAAGHFATALALWFGERHDHE